jgi:type IV secretion system protein VirB1
MIDLIQHCAPDVHPVTISAIVQQESGGNPLALNDNTSKRIYSPKTIAEAAAIARKLILDGHSVDIGLAQINSKNLPRLNLTVEQVLDPCTNLQASQAILKEGWRRSGGDLAMTFSAYNTGKIDSAIGQNYAAKVFQKAGAPAPLIPAIPGGEIARWVFSANPQDKIKPTSDLRPVRLLVHPPVSASPLAPSGAGLSISRF